MDNQEQKMIEELRAMMRADMDRTEIPARLEPDAIVKMLESQSSPPQAPEETDPVEIDNLISLDQAPQKKRNYYRIIRRVTALAAMLAVVFTGIAFSRRGSIDILGKGGASEGQLEPVKSNKSLKEMLESIINKDEHSRDNEQTTTAANPENSQQSAADSSVAAGETLASGEAGLTAPAKSGNPGKTYKDPWPILQNTAQQLGDWLSSMPENTTKAPVIPETTYVSVDQIKAHDGYLYLQSRVRKGNSDQLTEQIRILKAESGEMKEAGRFALTDASARETCFDIGFYGSRMVALMNRTNEAGKPATVIYCFDVSNPSSVKKIGTFVLDGRYVASNIAGLSSGSGKMQLITSLPIEGLETPGYDFDGKHYQLEPKDILKNDLLSEKFYLVISSLDLNDFTKTPAVVSVLGCDFQAKVSGNVIFAAGVFEKNDENSAGKPVTILYRFEELNGKFESKINELQGTLCDVYLKNQNLFALFRDVEMIRLVCLDEELKPKKEDALSISVKDLTSDPKTLRVQYLNDHCYLIGSARTAVADLRDANASEWKTFETIDELKQELIKYSDSLYMSLKVNSNDSISYYLVDLSDPTSPQVGKRLTITVPESESPILLEIVGDTLYTVSTDKICSFSISGGQQIGKVSLK